jgi:hypothetical protein
VRLDEGYSPRPHYLYLVASDRPLRVEEPLRWAGGALTGARTSAAGVRVDPTSFDAGNTFELLFDLVVDAGATDVATDVREYYPDVRFRRGGQVVSLTAFRCLNGGLVYAPEVYRYDGYGYGGDSWYGVDFIGNRYVGGECFRSYDQRGGGGVVIGGGPGTSGGGSSRLTPGDVRPHDVRPSNPVEPARLRPPAAGGGATPVSGSDERASRIERTPGRAAPRPEPRSEPRPEPQIRVAPPEARRAEPRPEPRPTEQPERRAEPRPEPRVERETPRPAPQPAGRELRPHGEP